MIGWIIAGISLAGTIINIESKNRICFVLWAIPNIYFLILDYQAGIYPQAMLMAIYFGLAIRGYILWGKEESKCKT